MAYVDCHNLGGGEPKPSPCSSQRPPGQPLAIYTFMKYKCPASDLAVNMPERWQEVIHSSGGLCYVNFSLHFPWKWLIFGAASWPNLLAEAGSPRGPRFPLAEPVGLNVGSRQPKPLDTVFILEIRNRCL